MIARALVLAAGKSTRISAVTGGLPKPLIEVDGRPVLERSLEWLATSGVREVFINLHYRPDDIRARIGDGRRFGITIRYEHEPEILGTAGAFRNLRQRLDGTTLVVYGDNLMRFDLSAFADAHARGSAEGTVALFDPERHANSRIAGGRVTLGTGDMVDAFVEGGTTGYVNAGAYLLERAVTDRIRPGFADFARDVFPAMTAERKLRGWVMEPSGYCVGLDTPESLRTAAELVSNRQVILA